MLNFRQNLVSIYAKVCSCDSKKCATFQEINNAPNEGSPPRGFYTSANAQVAVIVVAKNPGHVLNSEANSYRNQSGEKLVNAHLEFSKNTFYKINEIEINEKRSTTFHSNLLEYLSEILDVQKNLVFENVVYTNLVKCSTKGSKQCRLTTRSMDECFQNHLVREIDFFNPRVIFALGREVERYLKRVASLKNISIIYIRHPSYHYRKDLKGEKIASIKEKYRVAITCAN